jgi:hypothetical protein
MICYYSVERVLEIADRMTTALGDGDHRIHDGQLLAVLTVEHTATRTGNAPLAFT